MYISEYLRIGAAGGSNAQQLRYAGVEVAVFTFVEKN
jgi:hypothetical protein